MLAGVETPAPEVATTGPEKETGLRSTEGIRWLLLVGALVVVVSLVRLVAEGWGAIPPSLQFLLLCAGNLGVYGAGELAHRRLRLPVASGALFGLFSVALPVLSWGAGRGGLLEHLPGQLAFVVGSAAAIPAIRRLLRFAYGYRGVFLPLAYAFFLGSLGILSFARPTSLWIPAVGLGLVLTLACRRIHRFFFHRDRLQGTDRPLDWVPFAGLIGLYTANLLVIGAGTATWAAALIFIAAALVEAGEEYFRALARVTGITDGPWPARSQGSLTLGFATGAVAVGLSWLAAEPVLMVLVTATAAAHLIRWTFRYRQTASYLVGLPLTLVALHASPALFTGLRDRFVAIASAHFGYSGMAGATSAAALGELSLLAALVLSGFALRHPRLKESVTRGMVKVHAATVALLAAWNLALSLVGLEVMAQVAPGVALLAAAGAWILRHAAPLPVAHVAALSGVYALLGSTAGFPTRLLVVAAVNALLTGLVIYAKGSKTWSKSSLFLGFSGPLVSAAVIAVGTFAAAAAGASAATTWSALALTTVPWLLVALQGNHPRLAGASAVSLLACLQWLTDHTLDLNAVVLFDALVLAALAFATRRLDPSRAIRAAARGASLAALAAGSLWIAFGIGPVSGLLPVVSALFLATAAGFLLDSGLSVRDDDKKQNRGLRRLGIGLLYLALVPGCLVSNVFSTLGAQATFFLVTLCLARRLAVSPPWIYRLEGTYGGGSGSPVGRRLEKAADAVFRVASGGTLLIALWLTGPWIWTLLALLWLDAWVADHRVDGPTKSPVPRAVLPVLAWMHAIAYGTGGETLLASVFTALLEGPNPWTIFAASLYFALSARRRPDQALSSTIAAVLFFLMGFYHLVSDLAFGGAEMHLVGPGLALLAVAYLLRARIGETWSTRLVTAGAGCLYAAPTLTLLRSLMWGHQIVLLLLAVAFGALSFRIRSRSLLLLSTGAVVVDLGFFLLKLGRTEPTFLWIAGLLFGLGLMAVAGYLERRRELALQQVRLWGDHLRAWR